MVFKLLTAILVLAVVNAQEQSWDDEMDSENEYGKPIMERCNTTFCHSPCVGAAPPPTCPENIPECPSGCACFMDCTHDVQTCFMTSHCKKIRRFVTKRRHARSVQSAMILDPQMSDLKLSAGNNVTVTDLTNVTQSVTESSDRNLSPIDDVKGLNLSAPIAVQNMTQNTEASIAPQTTGHVEGDVISESQNVTQSTIALSTPAEAAVTSEKEKNISSQVGRVERDLQESVKRDVPSSESQNVTQSIALSTPAEAKVSNGKEKNVSSQAGRVERDLQESAFPDHEDHESVLHPTVLANYDAVPETETDEKFEKEPPLPFLSNYQTGLMEQLVPNNSEDKDDSLKSGATTPFNNMFAFFFGFCRFMKLLCIN